MRLSVKEFDEDYYQEFETQLLKKGFKHLGTGAFRRTFGRGKIVIKIPYNDAGFQDNITEAYAYRTFRNEADPKTEAVFAPCRLLPNGCLMMVYIEYAWSEGMPRWTHYIDGGQCGFYKDRVVAYDSGGDISHLRADASRWAGVTGVR